MMRPFKLLSVALGYIGVRSKDDTTTITTVGRQPTASDLACLPFLPKLFTQTPPAADHALIRAAAAKASAYLEDQFVKQKADGLSVAVVTSTGTLFEQNWGVQRANESETSPAMGSHSSYRLASVSKVQLAFEGWQLEQQGIISWDDPVSKHLPSFKPNYEGFTPGADYESPRITLRDLATHLSGLGRDWPPGTTSQFPADCGGSGPPPENGLPFPDHQAVFDAIAENKLVSPPAHWPSYSNTGIGVLGMALVAANRAASTDPEREPRTIAELMQRDVFGPLGMNGSHYALTPENRASLVVSSVIPEIADLDFLDAMNPSGGQFASLSDLSHFARALLAPGKLAQSTLDRWFKPVHSFEEDDWTELGLVFEVIKHIDSFGRRRRIYWKLGELPGYHSVVAVHPGTGYAVTLLLSADYADAASLAYSVFDIFQPALDGALAELSASLYAGEWVSNDGTSSASIAVREGTVWIDAYVVQGKEVLTTLWAAEKGKGFALRETGRRDELRVDTGLPGWNGHVSMGCYAYWGAVDSWGLRKGAAVNLITFSGDVSKRVLHIPAVGVTLQRKK